LDALTTFALLSAQQPLGAGQGFNIVQIYKDGGFMMHPLLLCALAGLAIIIWKFIDLQRKARATRAVLADVDPLIGGHRIKEASTKLSQSDAPVAAILLAGLKRYEEGTERVMKAIENAGLIQLAALERGLVALATISNVAPLMGFLGTVVGMIQAFQAIELAGEVEATLVAAGIKVALITTASGLSIAIPINIAHNYFVTRIDQLVIEMEESAQKMIDALHAMEAKGAGV
jgi:biopolymer transport protein ExbB